MGSASSTAPQEAQPVESDDSKHPDNIKAEHEGWSSLTEKPRGCTDCLCLLVLLSCWFAMTILGFIGIGLIENPNLPSGNPRRLLNAVDFNGRVCGYDSLKKEKYGYYMLDKSVVCVSSCPTENNFLEYICQYDVQADADSSLVAAAGYLVDYKCFYKLETKPYLNRCVPSAAIDLLKAQAAANYTTTVNLGSNTYSVSASSGWFGDFLGDVYKMSGIVFGIGFGVSTAIAFIYLYVLRIPGCLFVSIWAVILGVQVCIIVGAFLLWSLANSWEDDGKHTNYQVIGAHVLSYIVMGIAALYFCLMLVLRSRVQLAIGVVQEAGKALGNMQTLLLTPILQVVGLVLFMVPWIIYVIYLASSGEMVIHKGTTTYNGIQTSYSYRTFDYTVNTKYAFLYMIFSYYWTSEFITACGQMLIALAFSNWYFTRDKSTTGNSSVLWALWATFRYHMGTAAFGSLIIAIIKTIRAVINYFAYHAKKSKNFIVLYILACVNCLLWCVEKCMKFLNKNAYIETAIYGYSFCKAARRAFFLLIRNILRVSAVNVIATFVLLLGKLFVVSVTVFLAYLAIAYSTNDDQVSGIISPLIFIGVISYGVASIFTEIFGMGIETILLCYIADEEMFPPEQRFAEGSLKTSLQKAAERAAANAKKVAPAPPEIAAQPVPVQAQVVTTSAAPNEGVVL